MRVRVEAERRRAPAAALEAIARVWVWNWEYVEVIRKKKGRRKYSDFIFGEAVVDVGCICRITTTMEGEERKIEGKEEKIQTNSSCLWERVCGRTWKKAENRSRNSRAIVGKKEIWDLSFHLQNRWNTPYTKKQLHFSDLISNGQRYSHTLFANGGSSRV